MYYRIRNLREDKDLSQEQLAKLLNVSQTTYSRYETGNLDIPSQSLIKLAQYYSTSVDYLLNLTDIKTPYGKHQIKSRTISI
ncbi:helix-turn-helix transcriptional regulator [Enterococcus faecalis]|uniref:helix-turn-helix domain-containing protein n=1 Tax=Enterococcus faecalis TaxID=1351 RepID=UPI0025B04BD0|nr:helix-turn-helix transcriptional regulator [Enterococcus faecalis]MDN3138849.1 helix-turn-helix transcriptional regulator [Enterococcus faecalis]